MSDREELIAGVRGPRYFRRMHPYSSMLIPTDEDDPEGFPANMGGLLMHRGDRDITGRPATSSTPPPWNLYDPHYESRSLPEEYVRLMEGMSTFAKKFYGLLPKDAEPIFLSQDQMDAAGLYHLCDLCQVMAQDFIRNVNARWPEEDQGMSKDKHVPTKHYDHMHALRLSAEAGCHLCSLLYPRDCVDKELPRYEVKLTPNQMIVIPQDGPANKVKVSPYIHRPLLSTALTCHRTDERPVMDQAKQWLSSCMNDHTACNDYTPLQTGKLPETSDAETRENTAFRLIEIVQSNDEVQSIRLTEKAEVCDDTKYLTLSHCWGGADIIKLTQSSLARFSVDIPMSQLPKNFSDAISVTARLGFTYIWIDSLCIIQDLPEDWCTQARQMGKIYWYSQCTLAALKSTSPDGGLFCKRPMLSMNECLISKDGGNAAHNLPVFAEPDLFFPKPLHTRGWVVQERFLSRRTLNFGADMVTWNCVTAHASEVSPQFDCRTQHEPSRQLYDILNDTNTSKWIFEGHWLGKWWDLVADYTNKSLTFESDRFPAIEGLARIVQDSKGISMVHGLWQPYLVNELLWSFDMEWNAPVVVKSEQQLNSPSWTWVSTNQAVYHYDLANIAYRPTAVVQHESDLPRWTPKVPVHMITGDKGCFLMASACMLPIQYTSPHAGREREAGRDIKIYPFRFCDGRDFPPEGEDQYWDGHWKPDVTPPLNCELYAIELIQRKYREDHTISMGLIVYRTDEEHELYMRVGMYEIEWGERREKNWRELNGMKVGYEFATTWEERDGERWFGEHAQFVLQ
ncbi:heterokaryon incompatibility protein [Stagonosporopsis vannaccii]|nr:heterokaryon incompatibility protein [Stagonosporopsis vannaccii]